MSNINNQAKTLNGIAEVQELDNETAAAIQGGADYGLVVYRHANLGDELGSFNFGSSQLSSNANNQISSVKVNRGKWRLYNYPYYNTLGGYVDVGVGNWNVPADLNDKISSIKQISG